MTQHSTLATDGQADEPTLTVWRPVMDPAAFAAACGYIVQTETREEAHRQLDQLVTTLLYSLGYSEGMDVFLRAVGSIHDTKADSDGDDGA
jgi:hypothetical protein